uniref:Putative salivary secreted protein n=1 Tax=Ixodes ricinus TaxID=34613 RepID=A0A6B0UV17_IXORI
MQGQTKIIIFGTVIIVYAIQNGVLSQWPPSPFGCYEDIMEVGNIFCTITGQKRCITARTMKPDARSTKIFSGKESLPKLFGVMNFFWPTLVVICTDAYLNLSIPFRVTGDEIVECPEGLQKKIDEWKERWSQNKEDAKKAFCDHIDRKW